MFIRFSAVLALSFFSMMGTVGQTFSKDVSVESLQFIEKFTKSVKKTRAYYSGKTLHFYARGHGTQIEYMAPNGLTYLWYPKNKLIVPGRWKIKAKGGHAQVCYKYPTNSYNPLTMKHGGTWTCQYAVNSLLNNVERVKGDPFQLRNGLPFKLYKSKTSLKRLARKAKLNHVAFTYLDVPPK